MGIETTARSLNPAVLKSIRVASAASQSPAEIEQITARFLAPPAAAATSAIVTPAAASTAGSLVSDGDRAFIDIGPLHRFYQKELLYLAEQLLPQGIPICVIYMPAPCTYARAKGIEAAAI